MPNKVPVRNTHKFDEIPTKDLQTLEVNDDKLAYQDLNVITKLSKGKFPTYLATSKINNKKYAMKVFSDIVKGSEEYYKNEVRFAALDHPNVINFVHYEKDKLTVQDGVFKNVSYILSEYAPNGDLFDFIINHKHEIDEKLARTYFRQLIDGLEYLHGLGIAHLDIKPENLLLDADFNLRIADFDLSYVASDDKVQSRGTKYYRAPEFYNATTSSKIEVEIPSAADIYSAGIILFILKSEGVYPHSENHEIEGVNFTDLLYKNNSKFWSTHCQIQGKQKSFFDSKFKDLFNKMVKMNPKQRPSIKKIKQSKWYNGPVYTPLELYLRMKTILLH